MHRDGHMPRKQRFKPSRKPQAQPQQQPSGKPDEKQEIGPDDVDVYTQQEKNGSESSR